MRPARGGPSNRGRTAGPPRSLRAAIRQPSGRPPGAGTRPTPRLSILYPLPRFELLREPVRARADLLRIVGVEQLAGCLCPRAAPHRGEHLAEREEPPDPGVECEHHEHAAPRLIELRRPREAMRHVRLGVADVVVEKRLGFGARQTFVVEIPAHADRELPHGVPVGLEANALVANQRVTQRHGVSLQTVGATAVPSTPTTKIVMTHSKGSGLLIAPGTARATRGPGSLRSRSS